MGAMQDRRRLWFVEQDIMRSSNHPFSHFGCGNITTLASLDQTNIRTWFSEEYDPRGMHLVVYSHEALPVLERNVKARFGEIQFKPRWKGPVRAEPAGKIVPSTVRGSWVFVEPIKTIRNLKMMWELPAQFGARGSRVGEVSASVLQRAGNGSILSKLKSEGLVSSISAEVENEAADAVFFYIDAELTGQGLLNIQRIVEIIFQGIGTLGRIPLPRSVVEAHNTLSTLNYKWQARRTDYRAYAEEAYNLRQEDLSGFPRKSLFWEQSPEDVANIFLSHLSPNNSIVFVQAKRSDTFNVTFDRAEPITGVKYSLSNFSEPDLAVFIAAHGSQQPDIFYPGASPFMPDPNVRVLHPLDPLNVNRTRWEPKPVIITGVNVSIGESTFIAPDVEFGIPRISLRTSLISPAFNITGNPRKEMIGYLFLGAIHETTEQLKAACEAGGYSYVLPLIS
jgi:insulysin